MADTIICRVCGAMAAECHRARILRQYEVSYYRCKRCEYLQTEAPFWLDEAYSNSINLTDTGLVARNIKLADIGTILFGLFFNRQGRFLDYAGGYGLFVRLMRDIGFDFYWSDKYCQNLLARGFEGELTPSGYEAITAFEVFEHFVDPIAEIKEMGQLSDAIFFSTELYDGQTVPAPGEWDYYGVDHGQHIGFFSRSTLTYIADVEGYHLWSDGRWLHVFSRWPLFGSGISAAIKARRLGLANVARRLLKTRTLSDVELLK